MVRQNDTGDSWAEVERLRNEAEKCVRAAEDPHNGLALIFAANLDMMASSMAARLNRSESAAVK